MCVVRRYSGKDEEPHTSVPRPVSESIRFRLRPAVLGVTLIFPRAPARMPLPKNPPVCRHSTYQVVIIYLIGTFPYDDADRSPWQRRPACPKSKRYILLHSLCSCSHTLCQDTWCTTHTMPLDRSPLWCYHARVRVCVPMLMRAYVPLGLAVSHAGGLSQHGLCVCLGVGVSAVLGPKERRFGLVLIQTTQLG